MTTKRLGDFTDDLSHSQIAKKTKSRAKPKVFLPPEDNEEQDDNEIRREEERKNKDSNADYMSIAIPNTIDNNKKENSKAEHRPDYETNVDVSLFDRTTGVSPGLSIMEKMGFRIGQSLGRSSDMKDVNKLPIHVSPKANRAGIGEKSLLDSKSVDSKVHVMKILNKKKTNDLKRDLKALSKLCFEMSEYVDDFYAAPKKFNIDKVNPLWRNYVRDLKTSFLEPKSSLTYLFGESVSSSTVDDNVNALSTSYNTENLPGDNLEDQERYILILKYLRENHFYCWYCGTYYTDQKDLVNNCPGPTKEDHNI